MGIERFCVVLFFVAAGCEAPPPPTPSPSSRQGSIAAGVSAMEVSAASPIPAGPPDFGKTPCTQNLSTPAWDIAGADMDGDSDLDLIVARGAYNDPECILILHNPGTTAPLDKWPVTPLGPKGNYGRLSAGDINKDSRTDLVALSTDNKMRWWLSKDGSFPSFSQGEMRLGSLDCDVTDPTKMHISSVALSDIDGDDYLDASVSSYADGPPKRAPLRLLRFNPFSSTFEKKENLCGWGAMRARFYDMDHDGIQDLITSLYRVEDGQWGEWWRAKGDGTFDPVSSPLKVVDTTLLASGAVPSAVDFDIRGTHPRLLFALSLSGHGCAAPNCWTGNNNAQGIHGGFTLVIDRQGNEKWSSMTLESHHVAKQKRADGRTLVPSVVRFLADKKDTSVLVAYWWAKLGDKMGEPGPFLLGPINEARLGRFGKEESFTEAILPFQVSTTMAPDPCAAISPGGGMSITGKACVFPLGIRGLAVADAKKGLTVLNNSVFVNP